MTEYCSQNMTNYKDVRKSWQSFECAYVRWPNLHGHHFCHSPWAFDFHVFAKRKKIDFRFLHLEYCFLFLLFFLYLRINFIWMEYLRFFFIVSGTEEMFEFEMFCSEELLFSIAGRCPGAQSTFLLQSVNSHKTDSPGKTIRHTMINQESIINKQK